MNITKEEKKKEAVLRMKKLGIISDAVKQFNKNDTIMISEPPMGGLYWLNEEQKGIVEKFEKEYNALVYMVIRSYTQFGKMDSLLYISDYDEEWKMDRDDLENNYIMTYTVNYDHPEFSEFGSIVVKKIAGSLLRVG